MEGGNLRLTNIGFEEFGFGGFGFGGFGFDLFPVLFFLVFALIIGVFIVNGVKSARQWNKNNHSPQLTVPAVVAAKRTRVSGGGNHNAHTSYYVTFQVESGDRMELSVDGSDYGLLAEGDKGKLTFQGTRFLSFERSFG